LNGEKKVIKNISTKLVNQQALFNDVMLKDGKRLGNIDHIFVGPRGIFAVETKHFNEKVTVNGDYWKSVRGNPSQQTKNHAKKNLRALTKFLDSRSRNSIY